MWKRDGVFIIAEAGVNHNGQIELALQLVDAAASCGADAVKFQTFRADRLVTPISPKAAYQNDTTDPGESQLAMLAGLELDESAHHALLARCHEVGIAFLSTPFDAESLELLLALEVPGLKLGSGELTDLPLLEKVARAGRPVVMSTGMSYLSEVEAAVRTLGGCELALLHCVSSYPAPSDQANLKAMDTLRQAFGVPVGFSDHTPGRAVALAAVARGAQILEKHLTLSHDLPGPDHRASLEPVEFARLVAEVRLVEASLGHGRKEPQPCEWPIREIARKSLVTGEPVAAGEKFTEANLLVRRPGSGLEPGQRARLLGRRAVRNLPAFHLLTWDDVG